MNELISETVVSDKEISDTVVLSNSSISRVFDSFKEKMILKRENEKDFSYCYRDHLFHKLLTGWNIERVKAGFKPLSKARLASAINSNPFLKSDDGELELLINECEKKGNYKKAHWILFGSKKKK